jgi:hypothetical protein
MSDNYNIEVNHKDADTVSFVGDSEEEVVTMYLIDMDEEKPILKIAEFSPEALDKVLEQAAAAKFDAERSGAGHNPDHPSL